MEAHCLAHQGFPKEHIGWVKEASLSLYLFLVTGSVVGILSSLFS